jgi:signal transduction histidine kinase/DNA-binding response OmpR family regulator
MTVTDDRLRAAVDAMADGAIVADTRTQAVLINKAARVMLGIPIDAVVDTNYLKDTVGFYPFDLAVGAVDGEPVREEVRIGDRVLHSVVTVLREDGDAIGAIVVLRDLGDTADLARRRAEFAQVMSHELRTPLTSVAGALDIVLSGYAGPLTDRQLRYVDMARQAATRMNQLVDQLLDLARAQAGAITVSAAPVQLDRLAREVIDRYRSTAATKHLTIVLGASAEDISILGDPERLSQVLGNLVVNAIRFAPSGGVIDVQVFGPPLSEDAVGVSVHNSGDPIPPEDREKVFEPFSASSRRVGGTALGLSISRTIVEAHGGRIWVESDVSGTKFVFTLPVSAKGEKATQPMALEQPRRRGLDGVPALVVDDDPRRALLLKGLLMSLTDKVFVANDADAALAIARQEHPALAVIAGAMDDALALLAIMEHDPDTSKTAVMVVGEPDRRADLIAAGADDLLEFPIQPAMFRDACLRLVDSGRREAPRVLVVDDDSSIRQICREVLELGGYQVRDAGSANAALAEARRFRPDMILMDVLMPGIDGYRTAEMIRSDAAIAMAPIMFLSARGDTADKVRAFRSGAEDYMVKPFDAAELLARVGKALDRQARELGASPTTQLPGADAIQAEIERRLSQGWENGASSVACYLDLDNLKAFNDYYGYAKANSVIRQTGDVIRNVIMRAGSPGDFIGHIAGDDFVFVTTAEHADAVCRGICERFDHLIRLYYDPKDRAAGYIETNDRFGVQRKFPIMSVSIAAISLARAKTYAALAELAAVGKRTAKGIPGSAYVRDGQTMMIAAAG